MSTDTSSQEKSNTETIKPKASSIGIPRSMSLRKRTSLKPRKSLLKVRSLRPTTAVLGKLTEK